MLERGRGKYPSTPLQVKEHLELQWGEHLSPAFYVTRPRLVQSRGSRSVVLRRAASSPPGTWSEIRRCHLRLAELETLGVGPAICVLAGPPDESAVC